MQMVNGKPVLYKCPYCVKGRFTEDDGWKGAVKHIREHHQNGNRKRSNRGRSRDLPSTEEELDLLEGPSID